MLLRAGGGNNTSHLCYITAAAGTNTTFIHNAQTQVALDALISSPIGFSYDTDNAADLVNFCINTPPWAKYIRLMGRVAMSGVLSAIPIQLRFLRDRGSGVFSSPAESHYVEYYVTDNSGALLSYCAYTPKILVRRDQAPNFSERWGLFLFNGSGVTDIVGSFGTENWLHAEFYRN